MHSHKVRATVNPEVTVGGATTFAEHMLRPGSFVCMPAVNKMAQQQPTFSDIAPASAVFTPPWLLQHRRNCNVCRLAC